MLFADPPPPEGMVTTHSTTRPPSDFPFGILHLSWQLQRPPGSKRPTPLSFREITWETMGTLYIRVPSMQCMHLYSFHITFMVFSAHIRAVPMNPPSTSKKTSLTGIGPRAAACKSCFVAARFARVSCISKTHGQNTKPSRCPPLLWKTL